MISSISLRSPQKTCGLFDIGYAGGDADVTSLDLNAPIGNPFSLNSLKSASFATSDPLDGGDAYAEGKLDSIHHFTMDTFDILDPLADLETDQLMDDSLDAFINLDQFLMGNTFFDDDVNVKQLTDVPTIDSMTLSTVDTEFFLPQEPSVSKSRKRKARSEVVTAKPVKTSMFEIPVSENIVAIEVNPEIDHDYTAKHRRMSVTSEDTQKHSTNSDIVSKHKSTGKATFTQCEPSTSSDSMFSFADNGGTDKQTIRRIKNNVASKKSREQRKQKFVDMDVEAEILIQANEELRQKIVELEKAAAEMKAMLVSKMTGR